MLAGRPAKYNKEELLDKLFEWVRKEDSNNLNGFCAYAWIPYSTLNGYVKEDPRFSEAYDLVRAIVAVRREEMMNNKLMAANVYQLNARVYDRIMNQQWEEEQKFISDLRKEEALLVPKESSEKLQSLVEQLNQMQEDSKIAFSKESIDM